jgi:hypothetical protein
MAQLSEGFQISQRIQAPESTLYTPGTRNWEGQVIRYSAILESLRLRVAQPTLGPPNPLPEGLEDLGQVDRAEIYRSWIWQQPRRQVDLLIDGVLWASVPILNRTPFYVVNLMPYLSSQSTLRLAYGKALSLHVVESGFGPLAPTDNLTVMGEGVLEADVADLSPQFSALEQRLDALLRSQIGTLGTALGGRLYALEGWTLAQSPKIQALRLQGDENTLALAQAASDLQWIRRNWGSGGGGGDGGSETIVPLASSGGEPHDEIPGAFKFRNVPPGTYKIKISIGAELLAAVPTADDPKTIEIVSWSEEPTNQQTGFDSWGNARYNWNDPAIVRWVADLPRSGGEITLVSTNARRYFGVKVRNANKSDSWNNYTPYQYYLDGIYSTEQPSATHSAEWVARSF